MYLCDGYYIKRDVVINFYVFILYLVFFFKVILYYYLKMKLKYLICLLKNYLIYKLVYIKYICIRW